MLGPRIVVTHRQYRDHSTAATRRLQGPLFGGESSTGGKDLVEIPAANHRAR
jgi:hypothetical protein